ncbi:MAG: chorismate--pyruvate lyase family protein [Gammaproteobacteria bacterium]
MTAERYQKLAPMEGYFKSKGYVSGGIITNSRQENLDMAAIPPFLRTLLVTDGTVTKSLEAYFWEPVIVENLGQTTVQLTGGMDWLGMRRGDEALSREVRLLGDASGKVYAYARSWLRLDFLPPNLKGDLLAGKIGIGEILRERGLESYREILDMGRELDESLAPVFNAQPCGELLYRTYRVIMQGEATILITEKFPRRLYADPA